MARPSTPPRRSPTSTPSTWSPYSRFRKAERRRARRELAEEIDCLPNGTFFWLQQKLMIASENAPRRSADELAKILNDMSTEEYGKLRELLEMEYDRRTPLRRAEDRDAEDDE